jgi:valyl-tRNA synthetase
MNLGELSFTPLKMEELAAEDRWILARLSRTADEVTKQLEAYRPSAALAAAREFFWGEFCDWYLELIKPRMRDDAQAPIARQVLAVGLDRVLRLLHPFVPFITEALWSYLREQAPERGIGEPFPDSELCITARWPRARPEWQDEALEHDMAQVQAVIGKLRELRSRNDVAPRKELPAVIKATGDVQAVLQRYQHLIVDMARLGSIAIDAGADAPANAATEVFGDMEISLGDVLDPEKERVRLEGKKKKLSKQLEVSEKKLANEKFVAKAKPEVVEAERGKAAEFKAQLAIIDKSLAEL